MGSSPGYGLMGDWASTRDNGSKMGGASDRRFPLVSLLWPINSCKSPDYLNDKNNMTMQRNGAVLESGW